MTWSRAASLSAALSAAARLVLAPCLVLAPLVVSLGGCAYQQAYGFRPAPGAGDNVSGFPATRYALPTEAPTGEIYVAAPEVHRPEGAAEEVVHVRLAVGAQPGSAAWSLDPGRQVLALPSGQQLRPDYMDVPDGNRSVPFVVLAGTQRSLDLFYKLPPGQSVEGNFAGFQLSWEVAIGDRPLAMQTPFLRQPIDGDGAYVAVGIGVPWWWYRPLWWNPWYGAGWGYGYGGGWGRGYGYGSYGWGSPRTFHSWGAGAGGAGRGGGWRGGGGARVRGVPSRH